MQQKKLLIICPYPQGFAPSQRLKFEQYFDAFKEDGWEITVEPFINLEFWKIIYKKGFFLRKAWYTLTSYWRRFGLLSRIKKFDVVYVHLWVTPFGPPLFESWIKKRAKKLIYDIDDLVYLRNEKSKAHPLVNFIKGRKKPIYLMKESSHVITCTPYLDEFVRRYNNHTTDISSTVDTCNRYFVVNDYSNHKFPTIGWSGSLSTSKYFYLLKNVFQELSKTHRFKILVIGDPDIKINGLEIEALAWKESIEMETLQRFDIGVYPLPNEEWVLGKSGLKAIQYMALGVPTVATAIGANFRVMENGVSGFLVKTDEEWISALSQLLEDVQLRKFIGMNGRKRVEEKFSLEANKQKYLDILNGVSE
jgi:glycosyltransferase involved in cell wall biosynthesis